MAALALLAFGVLAVARVATAQSAADVHFLTNMPPAGSVSTGFVFPTYPTKAFPAGKMADVVLGIRNEGSETYNISMIAGSLNSPVDFNVHLQNFTQLGYGQVIKPGEELSLEYKFLPDPRLEPRDFIVALTAFYVDSQGKWYSSTFFNETINIVEVKKIVDWELLFLILLFAIGISGIAYGVYAYTVSVGWVKSQKKRTRSRRPAGEAPPVMSAEDQQDWIKGTPYDNFAKNKAKAASKRASTAAH